MKWTADQEKSIYANPSQIVVSAAAGSGKTQVLTTRIIERIKSTSSPVSVEKLLIVTFTKAAAAEMKERIGKALRNAAKEETNPEMRKYLKRQLSLLGSAKICTIDSFCYDVVKQNFFKANIPSDISIGETGELSLLKLAALEETIDALYCALSKQNGDPLSEENLELADIIEKHFPDAEERRTIINGFYALTNTCGYDNRDSEFTENNHFGGDYTNMISTLYNKAQSAAYPEQWLNNAARIYRPEDSHYTDTIFYDYAYTTCLVTVKDAISTYETLLSYAEAYDIGYQRDIAIELDGLRQLTRAKSFDELRHIYSECALFPGMRGLKKNRDKFISSGIKETRKRLRETVSDTLSKMLEFSVDECESLRIQLYPQIKALCSAAILLGRIYYDKMTERKIMDFSTCAHLALNIISSNGTDLSETGLALKNKFDEIYIDEIQDSNDLQDMLFSLISKGRDFMVGDVKQSIYGFRNADPSIFMKKCEESLFDENAAKRKIFLSQNFRSRKCIIDGVNSIFDVVMTADCCGIDYKKEHRLEFGTDFIPDSNPNEKCEILAVEKQGPVQQQRENEAAVIGKKIKEIIESGRMVWDKDEGKHRAAAYSDITILSRSLKNTSAIFESVFASMGIPCYVDGSDDLYETNEIGQVMEILKLIDNSQSEISLACALRSPMFMFNENELLTIKLCSKFDFCDAFYGICSGKYETDPVLTKKCRRFMNCLSSWRSAADFATVEEIIRRIYTDTNIYSSVLSFPDGQLRRANLDLLLEKAEEFEKSSYSGLFNFVNYIQKIKRTSSGTGEAKAVNEKMNVVRIMTIHKSKGLEFPIVFVADCGNKYMDIKHGVGGLLMNSHAGLAISVINPLLRCCYKSPMENILHDMEFKENVSEEMRLFYVALTRAREKLYVVATIKNPEAFDEMQLADFSPLSANEIRSCQNYLSLLAVAYSRGADKFWEVRYITPDDAVTDTIEAAMEDSEFCENPVVSEMLDFEYEHKAAVLLPNKASVSALKTIDLNLAPSEDGNIPLLGSQSVKKVLLRKPNFGKKAQDGAFFGTAHHKLLQYIEFRGEAVQAQCDKLLEKGILTKEVYSVIQVEKIEEFLDSDLGKKLRSADKIYREESFVISINANELSPSLPAEETICVQGIIDCFFEYEGTIILLDYKTDSYTNPTEVAEKYHKQLYYYEKALKSKFKDKIIQKYLYLLHKNDIIEL